MHIGRTEQEVAQWNDSMHVYEKQKRTKKPFGKQFNPIDNLSKSTKANAQFDIIQHQFRTPELKNVTQRKQQELRTSSLNRYYLNGGRNARNFDIITLYGAPEPSTNNFKTKQLVRNMYNPINNQPLPDSYFMGKSMRLPVERTFKNIKPGPRDFNIVTGNYHEHNLERKAQEQESRVKMIHEKYDTKLNYNPVIGQSYSSEKQKQYEAELSRSQVLQSSGQEYNKRFPPTYIQHEPLILDPTKPLSQSVVDLDTRKQNAKQRYKLKYMLEREYEQRNIDYEDKKQRMLRNRVYNSHSMDGKAKQFSMLQMRNAKDSLAEQLWGPMQTRDRLQNYYNPENRSEMHSHNNRSQMSSSRGHQGRDKIKSGGFVNS